MSSKKLQFVLGLVDKMSNPAGRIMNKMNDLTRSVTSSFIKIGAASAGLFGVRHALEGLLGPSIELDRAMGEVRSLGVREDAMASLTSQSIQFSNKYGESASEFVKASYDIQSAIDGLQGSDLANLTNQSAILAKGTKSDVGVITDYMGTMYGIFKTQANAMGKSNWAEQLAGQTASAVQMFKTTGSEMASAFSNLGAEATANGVIMSEQMAILGKLQSTMSGSEAGTKYKAFLSGVGKAQDELGLTFTDSQGRLLPMLDILGSLKGKFGEIDTVAESDALKKAFGTSEAVALIKLLMADMDGLKGNITDLGKINNSKPAQDMAKAIADPWERLQAFFYNTRIMIGNALLPVLNPLVNSFVDAGAVVERWTTLFPNLTSVIGFGVIGVLGLTAAFAGLGLIAALTQTAIGGLRVIMWPLFGLMKLMKLSTVALTLVKITWFAAVSLAPAIFSAARVAVLAFSTSVWAMSAALLANPITWIVLGITALVAAVGAAIYYWDDLKSAITETVAFQWISEQINGFVTSWNLVIETIKATTVFQWISEKIEALANAFGALASLNPLEGLTSGLSSIGDSIGGFFGFGVEENLNAEIDSPELGGIDVSGAASAETSSSTVNSSLSKVFNQSQNKTVGDVHIYSPTPVDGKTFAEDLELYA